MRVQQDAGLADDLHGVARRDENFIFIHGQVRREFGVGRGEKLRRGTPCHQIGRGGEEPALVGKEDQDIDIEIAAEYRPRLRLADATANGRNDLSSSLA